MSNRGKIDLTELKKEIDTRKSSGVSVVEESANMNNKNAWLGQLVKTVTTGEQTDASVRIDEVNKRANHMEVGTDGVGIKKGAPRKYEPNLLKHVGEQKTNKPLNEQVPSNTNSKERDDNLYNDFAKMKKTTSSSGLAESIANLSPQKDTNNRSNRGNNSAAPINEEVIGNYMNGYLENNLNPLLEGMMKNTLIEMYSVDRVKRVLKENPEVLEELITDNPKLIENIVINTIKKLQARKKPTK